MGKITVLHYSVLLVLALIFANVHCEPPVMNSGGWGQQQQQNSGSYSSGYSPPAGGYSGGQTTSGGWGQQQQQQAQPLQNGGGGWGQQQQPQVQSNNNGGWGQQAQPQQQSGGNGGWGNSNQNQMKGGQNNGGWGPQLNVELDTANLKLENLNPAKIFKSIFGIPKKIIMFIRESGLYLLAIPLIIILPLMLLAFNFGRTIGGLGWGWGRSLSTVESGIVGYLKSPAWQKIGETLMDEKVFDRIMKSIDEFKKNWWRKLVSSSQR